jgi:hypothetical protein
MRLSQPIIITLLALTAAIPGCATPAPRLVSLVDRQPVEVRSDQAASFTAPADGTVGIFDVTQNRPLFEHAVFRGQSVTVDQPFQRVIIETQSVTPVAVQPADKLQVVFKESK